MAGNVVLAVGRKAQFFTYGTLPKVAYMFSHTDSWLPPEWVIHDSKAEAIMPFFTWLQKSIYLHLHPTLCVIENWSISMWEIIQGCVSQKGGLLGPSCTPQNVSVTDCLLSKHNFKKIFLANILPATLPTPELFLIEILSPPLSESDLILIILHANDWLPFLRDKQ